MTYAVVEWFRHGPGKPRFTVVRLDSTVERVAGQSGAPFKIRFKTSTPEAAKVWIEKVGTYLDNWNVGRTT